MTALVVFLAGVAAGVVVGWLRWGRALRSELVLQQRLVADMLRMTDEIHDRLDVQEALIGHMPLMTQASRYQRLGE